MKYNKGEWTETYVFLKLLGYGKLYSTNYDLFNKEEYYNILKIEKKDINRYYKRNLEKEIIEVKDHEYKQIITTIPIKEIKDKSQIALRKIKKYKKGTFNITELNEILNKLGIDKVASTNKNKRDMTLVIEDPKTKKTKKLSFSIKSKLGKSPTILNASKATNFIIKIYSEEKYIKKLNNIQ